MEDKQRAYQRDVRGRFARPVVNVDAESRFGPMADSIEHITNVSGTDVRPGMQVRRHAPVADDLAQGGQPSPLRPRTARLIDAQQPSMVYATPRAQTLHGDVTTTETGRPLDAEQRYLLGDIDQSAPGEVNSWPQMRPYSPAPVHPDDAGYHNAGVRTAARGAGPHDPTAYLAGLDSHAAPATGESGSKQAYGDGGRTMSPRRAEDVGHGGGRRNGAGRDRRR